MSVHVEGISQLNATLARIGKNCKRGVASLNKQAALMVIQSAAKATRPGDGSKVSTLAKKHRFRPIVGVKAMHQKGKFIYVLPSGKTWHYDRFLSEKSLKKRGISRVNRAFRTWDRKTSSWGLIPYFGKKSSGFDESVKSGKIPHFGSAKAGWLAMYRSFGKQADTGDTGKKPLSDVVKTEQSIKMTNLVEYAGKISPMSGVIGLNHAEKRMRKSYENILERAVRK